MALGSVRSVGTQTRIRDDKACASGQFSIERPQENGCKQLVSNHTIVDRDKACINEPQIGLSRRR